MTNKKDVENFLIELHCKMDMFNIFYESRDKNTQALFDLELRPIERDEYIKKLRTDNYCSGPNKDTNDTKRPDYWEFGINVKGKEVYIKINMGFNNKPVICISFHLAERPIKYVFDK